MNKVPDERRDQILAALEKHGYLSVAELAGMMFVSIPTIRRDLSVLEREGSLVRTHGGASFLSDFAASSPFSLRYRENVGEKRMIGKLAARFVSNGDSLFIDSSSTSQTLVEQLPEDMNLTVLTNALFIARELGPRKNVRTEIPGGTYDSKHEAVFGSATVDFIKNRNADWFFFSCNGFDAKKGTMSNTPLDGSVKKAMKENATKTVLLIDHFKENKLCYYHLFGWDDVDYIVTDRKLSPAIQEVCEKSGTVILTPV